MRDLPIAYGNSCFAKKWSNKSISFDALFERLKTTVRTTETVSEYPKLPKAERDRVKDIGGFVGGALTGGRRTREAVSCRSMLALDVDHATPDFLRTFEALNTNAACVYSTHGHTPEAPRLRLILPLTRDVTPDEWCAVSRYFAQGWGIDQFDECSYRPHQLMYWPSTPSNGEYLYRRLDGDWLNPDEILSSHPAWRDCTQWPTSSRESEVTQRHIKEQQDPLAKDGLVGAFCRAYPIEEAMAAFLPEVYAPSVVTGRYDYTPADSSAGVVLYDGKYAYSHHATDPACGKLLNAFDLVRVHKFGDMEEKASFKAMSDFAAKDDAVKLLLIEERQSRATNDFTTPTPDTQWQKKLEHESRSTVLKNSLHNITLILQNDEQLKDIVFNQQLDGMEIKGNVPWQHPSKYWRDADDAQLVSYVDAQYGTFSQRNYAIAVTKVADDRSYHPIREYFAQLPPWDKIPRADTLLVRYLGAKDNEYVRAVTRKTLCAAAKRIFDPGCKFDNMLVLNGPQGIGKSTLIARLAGEWFSDSLNLGDTKDKTAAEKLQGYWILEIGELAGLRKAEVETLRSFLSRQNDIYRAAFGKRATPHPRQCIFFGTTNAESGYLRDTTGNRRFWPIKTPGSQTLQPWSITREEIQQIWAEVYEYVKAGETLHLSPRLEALAKDEQREALESDEREGLVHDFLETLLPATWEDMDLYERRAFLTGTGFPSDNQKATVRRTKVCNLEIWCEAFGKDRYGLKRSDSNELTAVLAKQKWIRLPRKEQVKGYGPQFVFIPKDLLK